MDLVKVLKEILSSKCGYAVVNEKAKITEEEREEEDYVDISE